MPAIIRRGDIISCGDRMAQGSPNVSANNIPVSRKGIDRTAGHCFTPTIIRVGAPTVSVNNIPVVRVGDPIIPHKCNTKTHGGQAAIGSPNVSAGNEVVNVQLSFESEQAELGAPVVVDVDSNRQPTASRASFAYHLVDDHNAPSIGPTDPAFVIYKNEVESQEGPPRSETPIQEIQVDTNPPATPSSCSDIDSHVGPFPGSFPLSPHFTLASVTTNARISNYPLTAQQGLTEKQIVCNLRRVCINVLEPLKLQYGSALVVNSGFRVGSGKSQHCKGQAVDVAFLDIENNHYAMFDRAEQVTQFVPYDQFIFERQRTHWLHISFAAPSTIPQQNRVLTLVYGSNPPRYMKGIIKTAA